MPPQHQNSLRENNDYLNNDRFNNGNAGIRKSSESSNNLTNSRAPYTYTPSTSSSEEKNVFIRNIHFDATEEELTGFLRENNLKVVKLNLHKSDTGRGHKGTGHVLFETAKEASYCCKSLSGFEYNGRPIYFELQKPNNQRFGNRD
jgi:RNA recognition motif-containing protein